MTNSPKDLSWRYIQTRQPRQSQQMSARIHFHQYWGEWGRFCFQGNVRQIFYCGSPLATSTSNSLALQCANNLGCLSSHSKAHHQITSKLDLSKYNLWAWLSSVGSTPSSMWITVGARSPSFLWEQCDASFYSGKDDKHTT